MTSSAAYRHLFLIELFHRADSAGLGIADGASFEAYPGLEDVAATYMESITDDVMAAAWRAYDLWRASA